MAKINLLDLGGGLVDGVSPTMIGDNQFVDLRNFIPFGNKLRRRDGVKTLALGGSGVGTTNSVFALREANGAWTVIVGHNLGLAKQVGAALLPLPGVTGGTGAWRMLQYLNTGYAVRAGGSSLFRFTSDLSELAGIPAPIAAPTLVDGGAGSVEAGTYFGVVIDVNLATGAESNPSPPSAQLTHGASKVIDWTFAISPTRQVTARKLARTLPNQREEYFFVTTIADNVTTTYSDNVVIDDLGPPVSFDNGLPPPGLKTLALWNERLMATDGVDVFLSEAQLPESWAEDTIIEVFRDDGHDVRALVALGDRGVIGKTNKTHAITQTGPRRFERTTISDRHGIWSQASCRVAEGRLIAYGGDNFYVCDGLSMKAIGNKEIRTLLDNVPENLRGQVVAEVREKDSLYVAAIPQNAVGAPPGSKAVIANRVLVGYNYKDGTWFTMGHDGAHTNAPSSLAEVFDADLIKHIYATYNDDNLYEFMAAAHPTDDIDGDVQSIKATLRTKAFLAGPGVGLALALQQLWVLASNLTTTMKVRIFNDIAATSPQVEREVSLSGAGWRLYNLTNMRDPGTTLQVGIEYTGADELEIEALALEVTNIYRTRKAV